MLVLVNEAQGNTLAVNGFIVAVRLAIVRNDLPISVRIEIVLDTHEAVWTPGRS
jgi:hypothetical protein